MSWTKQPQRLLGARISEDHDLRPLRPKVEPNPSSIALSHRGHPLRYAPALLYVPMGKGGKREKGVSRKIINAHVQQSNRRGGLNLVPNLPRARPLPYSCRLCHAQLQEGFRESSQGESSSSSSDSDSLLEKPARYGDRQMVSQRTSISKLCPSCGASMSSARGLYTHNSHDTRIVRLENGDPRNYLDTGMLDPFGTATVLITEDMNIDIRHTLEFLAPIALPIPAECQAFLEWGVPEMFSNSIMIYGLLAPSAANRQMLLGNASKGNVDMGLYYKSQLIKLLRPLMSSSSELLQVPTILGVNSLLAMSVYASDEAGMAIHIKGINNLLKLRGGFMGVPRFVIRMILQTTYVSAIWTQSIPPIPPTAVRPTEMEDCPSFASYRSTNLEAKGLGEGLLNPKLILNSELISIIRDLCDATLWREFYVRGLQKLSADGESYLTTKRFEAEYRLITLPLQPRYNTDDRIQEACRVALLTFSTSSITLLPPSSGCSRSLVRQLMEALNQPGCDLQTLWAGLNDVLIWVLFLGAHISIGQPEQGFFVAEIARCAHVLELHELEEVRLILMRFFYLDRVYHASTRMIWEEAMEL